MDRTSRPTRPPTMMTSSIPNPPSPLDPSSAYSSPVSSTASQGTGFPIPLGLGISGCGLEGPFDSMVGCSGQSPLSAGPAMPNNLMSTSNIYNLPLEAEDFCGRSCYEIYNGYQGPSQSPLDLYGTRPPSMTHDFVPMEVGTGQGMFLGQASGMPGFWMNTLISAPPSPLQSISAVADQPMSNQWRQEMYLDANLNSQTLPHSGAFHQPIPLVIESNASRATGEHHINVEPNVSLPPSTSVNDSTADSTTSRTSKRGRKPSVEKGCRCPVCGFYFTRRSNCVAHQKKHDPTFHRAIPCDECNKSFGRNADLRRHVDTVSDNLTKR